MLQLLALVLMSLALPMLATAQVCTGNIVLLTQAEVDSFACTEVTGNLTIGTIWYWDDITNLDSLAELVTVGGALRVSSTDMLPNLRGLSSLSTIRGIFWIIDNRQVFTSLDGLTSLTSVGGLGISNNRGLVSLEGLKALRSVGGIDISGNARLESLEGLNGITTTGSLKINDNDALTDLKGLDGLSAVVGGISIDKNVALVSLRGLSGVKSAANVYIGDNRSMISVEGLDSFERSNGYFVIQDHPKLSNVDDLSSLEYVGTYIRVRWNPELSSCTCGLANFLMNGTVGREIDIADNAPGCSSQAEVQQGSCGLPAASEQTDVIAFLDVKAAHPNPFISTTTLHYSLPEVGPVRLAVYDALGREVMVLVESDKPPGNHTVVFTAPDLPAGLYVVRLEQGTRTASHVIVRAD